VAEEKILSLSRLIKSGQILASCLNISRQMLKSGFTSLQINDEMEKFMLSNQSVPSFKGLHNYPFASCISFNEQIVHALPCDRKMEKGDIVTVDVGVSFQGNCTDAARTYLFGGNKKQIDLVSTAYEALQSGISSCIENNTVGDISYSIQRVIELNKYRTPIELGGHGVGLEPHTDPFIPNYGVPKTGIKLVYGMVLAIEPIVMEKGNSIVLDTDGFSIRSKNNCMSAHVEDTIIVTNSLPRVLTSMSLDGTPA